MVNVLREQRDKRAGSLLGTTTYVSRSSSTGGVHTHPGLKNQHQRLPACSMHLSLVNCRSVVITEAYAAELEQHVCEQICKGMADRTSSRDHPVVPLRLAPTRFPGSCRGRWSLISLGILEVWRHALSCCHSTWLAQAAESWRPTDQSWHYQALQGLATLSSSLLNPRGSQWLMPNDGSIPKSVTGQYI